MVSKEFGLKSYSLHGNRKQTKKQSLNGILCIDTGTFCPHSVPMRHKAVLKQKLSTALMGIKPKPYLRQMTTSD